MRAFTKTRSSTVLSIVKEKLLIFILLFILALCSSLNAQNITDVEYYFGNDPGNGNGTLVTATANTGDLTQSIAIPLAGLDGGFHTVSLRVKDDASVWSHFQRSTFYIFEPQTFDAPSNIAAAEYWFGTDPGNGNGTPLAIASAPSDTVENFAIPLGTLEAGFHTLSLRVKNLDDTWSLIDRKTFYIIDPETNNPPSNLAAAEYWFGEDPGNGNATPLPITGTPNGLTEDIVIPLGNLVAGFQTLSIRIKNLDGTWSLFDRKRFYIISPEQNDPISPLTDAEFLYDATLGFGTGTVVAIAPTGNPDEYIIEVPTVMVNCDFHDVSLSVKNALGNYSLYTIATDIEVFDAVPPTIVVFPNIIAALDANGQATITITDVNNGTFDDCVLISVVLNQAQIDYTCADLGENTVTITATDDTGKVSTQDVTITVVDTINPVAISQNITIQLDDFGNVTTTAAAVNNNSTDNCTITNLSLDITSFTCADIGANTVILTVTDQSGNQNSTTAIVTVEDNINPIAISQNVTIQLDPNGNASTTADAVDNNSTDNCMIVTKTLDTSSFTCDDLGDNTVTLTVIDQSGNQNTAIVIVTVEDNLEPVALSQDIIVPLDATGNVTVTASDFENNTTDNCGSTTLSINTTSFTCAHLGENTVVITATDESGNQSMTNATVTVEDNITPIALGQDITIQLDDFGNATTTASAIDNGSTDNCNIVTSSIDISNFTCVNLGDNNVILTVTDQSGNEATATVIVTVEDNINPVAMGQDITVNLEGNPSVSIVASNIDNSSTDNCDITLSIDVDTFTAIGDYPVVLTTTDGSGNTSNVSVVVTVIDEIVCTDTAIWTAGGWDISPLLPTSSTNVTIIADYDTAIVGQNMEACRLTINAGATVTIAAGDYILVESDITVDGNLIVNHEGSLVQREDIASVTNNGTINVNVTTALVDTRDFVMLGAPMDLETREDVWATAFNVQEFEPSLFVPFGPQEAGVMYNFQSTSLDVWNPKSGILAEGEGYLVFPQEEYTSPGGQFDYVYDTGTLNNGVYTRTLGFNGTQEGSPHMLSNPYASGIDADVFFTENPSIDAVYFWEHGATSSTNVPGPEARNYSMRDVSAYNSTGGVMAASGAGTLPNGIISTAQGFGVFAAVAGPVSFNNSMRVTEGNNTLRTTDIQKDRLWLRIDDLTYNEGSNALLGFITGATEGVDSKYDSGAIENVVSLYSYIADDFSNGYTIQGRESFDINATVKMGFNTLIEDEVIYKISLSDFDGTAWENATVYLIDNATGIVTNLNNEAYGFTAIKGVYKNRFLLKFQDRVLDIVDNMVSNVTIYPNPTSEILNISSPDSLIKKVTMIDIRGREVMKINTVDKTYTVIDISDLKSAVYFAQIETENGTTSIKFIRK